jgi:hypothetical protein
MYLVVFYVGEYVWVCGCVYKMENFRTLSAPSEIASLREAISSSAAFELLWETIGPLKWSDSFLATTLKYIFFCRGVPIASLAIAAKVHVICWMFLLYARCPSVSQTWWTTLVVLYFYIYVTACDRWPFLFFLNSGWCVLTIISSPRKRFQETKVLIIWSLLSRWSANSKMVR